MAAVAERIHYAEGRRTNFTVVAGALLAGGIAVLTFIIDRQLARIITYPAVAAAIASIVLLVVYARQTNRYPWTDATRTWKWFYRDALPNQAQFDPKWWTILWFGSERERLKAAYAEQLPMFRARLGDLKDAANSFDQDVQQLYVLHINEKFKNVHLSQLRSLFQIGVWAIVALVLLAVIVGAWADRQRLAEHRLTETYGDLRLQVAWRFISVSEEDQTVLVQVAAQNLGQNPVAAPS
ncbi:hypothetical protein [Chelativorans salis]|uniref:Uncharacterized protein n=1 Tax=Chelativorans salis TaxID=2978478 RepID=A0ABT2LQH9_9HYPH|nr:hypothetical protein [Chelativorans sp. EGI FJ00035]MCT7376807.1 hypothetical protein [Chelativorans sp. EGI FJ00035]